jgi:hypothetical protein
LFQPQKPVILSAAEEKISTEKVEEQPAGEATPGKSEQPTSTTSRLLEAKRRAQQRKERE